MNNLLSGLIALVLIVGATVWVVREHFPRIKEVVEYEQVQIDENTWVRRSALVEHWELVKRLRAENRALADKADKAREYIRINAYLNTRIDSILASVKLPTNPDGGIKDTTIVFGQVAGDSLFLVQSFNMFNNTELRDSLNIVQLRPVAIDVVLDGSMVYVSSRDFAELNFETYTTTKPPRYKWYHWLGAGALGGILTWELIR